MTYIISLIMFNILKTLIFIVEVFFFSNESIALNQPLPHHKLFNILFSNAKCVSRKNHPFIQSYKLTKCFDRMFIVNIFLFGINSSDDFESSDE